MSSELSDGERREIENLKKKGYSEEEVQRIHSDLEALADIIFDVYKKERRKMLATSLSNLPIGKPALRALNGAGYPFYIFLANFSVVVAKFIAEKSKHNPNS